MIRPAAAIGALNLSSPTQGSADVAFVASIFNAEPRFDETSDLCFATTNERFLRLEQGGRWGTGVGHLGVSCFSVPH